MTIPFPEFFDRYEWTCEPVDEAIWRTSFASEREEDFDLYVAHSGDWCHFAITPFTPPPSPPCRSYLYEVLVHLNQQIRLARFGVDADGDVNLLVDLPAASMDYATFATVLDTLVYYTQQLAHELARTATEPGYRSPLF